MILVHIKDKFWSCYYYILLWFFFLYYVLQWQWEWLWMSFVFFRFLLLLFNLKLMSCLTFLSNRFGFPLKLHYLSFHFFWLILSQMLLSKQVKNAIFCQELLPKCALTKKRSYESFCNLPTGKMSLTMNVLQQQPWKPQNKFFLRQSARNSIIW